MEQVMVRLSPERFDALIALVARAPLSPAEAVAVREWHEQAVAQVRAEAEAQQKAAEAVRQ